MDVYRIAEDIKFINQIGTTLNIEERLKLEVGLLKILENEQFDQILFWGKIEGVTKDYFIVLGLRFKDQYEFPHKKFYWSSNDFKFAELPPINQEYKDKVNELNNTLFQGQHDKILVQVTDPEADNNQQGDDDQDKLEKEKDPFADSDDEDNIKVPPKNFSELDRLAYVVRSIDTDCAVAPVGSYKLTPTHELRPNPDFRGLTIKQAHDLINYQHFRAPLSLDKQELIARDDALFKLDFLDPIQDDLPKGCWSLQSNAAKTHITIRSLLWPGFVGYHRADSNIFGYCYIGNGLKNVDLPFLL